MTRQPILSRAAIASAVALLVALLARFGVAVPPEVADGATGVAAVLAPLAVAYWARRHTTPVADPRDANGSPLVPAEAADEHADGASGVAGTGSYSPASYLPPAGF